MAETAFHYELNNPMGNFNAGTWNVLPAVLTTWSNLLATSSNQSQYDLYKQQAQQYVDTARDNAELIRSQGAIALQNLQYKNKLERGNDVLRVAAGNGNLSGSNLDVLVRKEKIRKMNEQTLNANYANQEMIEMVNGYKQAASVYGTMAAKANADKWSAWASILKGVETYVGLQVRDAKIQSANAAGHQSVVNYEDTAKKNLDYNYKGTGTTSSTDISTNSLIRFEVDKNVTDSTSLNNYIIDPSELTVLGNTEVNKNKFNFDEISFKL